nr:astacin isoform X1 [Parasteatoda tepidariorum]XP_042908023.1 astacin isoform X2 [Parasteatoda tepidariorum]
MFCLILLVLGTVVDFCKTNPPIYPSENYHDEFFQGDIYLRNGSLTWDKFATTQKTLRWPNKIVPYIFDDIYTESEKELMRSAMAEFEEKTCIKWVERTDEDSYVEIYSDMGYVLKKPVLDSLFIHGTYGFYFNFCHRKFTPMTPLSHICVPW